jgi:hypothetical protein
VELPLTGVTDHDGAVTKGASQEVRLMAQHAAAAQAICIMHHLWGTAGTARQPAQPSGQAG